MRDGQAKGAYRECLECFEEGFLGKGWKVEKLSQGLEEPEE